MNRANARVRWEYKVASDAAGLSEWGSEGWELVSVVVLDGVEKLYLKRPLPTISEEMTLSQREAVLEARKVQKSEGERPC